MVRVKICGLTRDEDVRYAIGAGADAVGFISGFPTSPRNLTLATAGQLIRVVPPFVDSVIVTNLETLRASLAEVAQASPDAIQLYGDPEPTELDGIRKETGARLIKVVHVDGKEFALRGSGFDAFMTDTYVKEKAGGTGLVSDWETCVRVRDAVAPLPMILSGGLTPGNVREAVSKVNPFAVDTSSGVESLPGVKDAEKVRAFIAAARDKR